MAELTNGSKVVCIDDDFYSEGDAKLNAMIKLFDQLPRKGVTYTIRDFYRTHNGIGITLEEIVNSPITEPPFSGAEPNFHIRRFKPLEEQPAEEIEEAEVVEDEVFA